MSKCALVHNVCTHVCAKVLEFKKLLKFFFSNQFVACVTADLVSASEPAGDRLAPTSIDKNLPAGYRLPYPHTCQYDLHSKAFINAGSNTTVSLSRISAACWSVLSPVLRLHLMGNSAVCV